jgi:hypothetical protein
VIDSPVSGAYVGVTNREQAAMTTYQIVKTRSGRYSYKTATWRCGKSWARKGDIIRIMQAEGWNYRDVQ